MNPLRGEFQIQLTDDLAVPCLMNLYALGLWTQEEGKALTDIEAEMKANYLVAVPRLSWAGVRCYHLAHDKELSLTYEKYAAMLGSCDWEQLAQNINQSLSLLDASKKKKATAKS